MCSDCEAYGLKKHGITRSDCIFVYIFVFICITDPSKNLYVFNLLVITYLLVIQN